MITINNLQNKKKSSEKIVALTAYDATMASIFDEQGVDVLLVGDSLGMVIYGYDNTVSVTMDMMINHTKAVANGRKNSMILSDMPFGSYHSSLSVSLDNAMSLIRAGANGVKVEGAGQFVLEFIKRMTEAGILVAGHLGYTPQHINTIGGNIVQGKSTLDAENIIRDAVLLEKAGASIIFLELIPAKLAKEISQKINVPTIGIGAGLDCDGQVLVSYDMLGLYNKITPKFIKKYKNLAEDVESAVLSYKEDVLLGKFPCEEHSF
jgi:3-methyl-2-oxobutanoate hydroxymethyltransferase